MKAFVVMAIAIGGTAFVAFSWLLAISIDYDKYGECIKEGNDRRRHSICVAWVMTDTIMSAFTLIAVFFEFKVGQREYTRKFRSRIMFAHSFSLDKFLITDTYKGKEDEINLGLDTRLKNKVIEKELNKQRK